MISDIRKSLQTRGVKLLIWAMLLSLSIGTVSMIIRFSGSSLEENIALVNGHEIGIVEFRRKYLEVQNMINEIRQTYGVQAPMILNMWGFDRQPEELVLDHLIGEKVMKSATGALGTHVNHEYIQSKLRDPYFVRQYLGGVIPPQAMRGGTLDVDALQYNLKRQGISEAEFDEMLEDALMRAFFFTLVEGGLYTPESALKDAYIGRFLKKKYAYVTVPTSRYVTKARDQKATQADIEQFYGKPERKETYRIPEKRSAAIWTFNPDAFGVTVSDHDIQSAYDAKKRDYIKKPAEVDVQHILFTFTDATKLAVRGASQEVLKEVKADTTKFAELAAKHSQSKDKGSTITLSRADKNRIFTNAAFALKKGDIAGVIETPDGFEIIKLIDKREPIFKSIAEVKDELAKKLKEEKFLKTFNAQVQRVLTQARDVPSVLTTFIEQHKGQATTVKDVTSSEKVLNERLFNLRKVGDRGFYQDGGKGVVIEVTGITQSVVPPLTAIQQKVETDLYEQRAQELLKNDISASVEEIRTGKKTLAQVAQALGATVEITNWVSFDDQEGIKKMQELKFKLPELAQLTKEGAVEGDIHETGGYILQVKQIDPFNQDAFDAKKATLRAQLGRQELQGFAGSLIQMLRDKADIQKNTQLLRQVSRG